MNERAGKHFHFDFNWTWLEEPQIFIEDEQIERSDFSFNFV